MRIGAGLLHYRFWPGVRPALEALLGQTRPPDLVAVVDNGSGDDSPEHIQAAFPEVQVVRVHPNRGPIAGMNVALDTVLEHDVDAVLQLTHDARLAPTALERLADRLEQTPGVGAVGPLISSLDAPDRLTMAGGMLDPRTWDLRSIETPAELQAWAGRGPERVDWLNGSAILYRTEALRQTGRLHEDYFTYFDEADHLHRMGRLGWAVECVPSAVAWERAGRVPPYYATGNGAGFVRRAGTSRDVARELLRIATHIGRDLVRRGEADVSDRMRGVFDFLRGRWGPLER